MAITPKMQKFLEAAANADVATGYAIPAPDKRQAAMARAYGFGETLDDGAHRRFFINKAGWDAIGGQQ